MQVISYYTNAPAEYVRLAEDFQAKHPYAYVKPVRTVGNWTFNCYLKPIFILECLDKFNSPLFYTDVDTLINKPECIQNLAYAGFDFGVHNWEKKWYHCGSMFINNTKAARDFLKVWIDTCPRCIHHRHSDQHVFNVLSKTQPIRILELPASYAKIAHLNDTPDPVISHYQASLTQYAVSSKPEAFIVPRSMNGMRIMRMHDGSYCIPRKNSVIENAMNTHCVRDERYPLRWFPKADLMDDTDLLFPWFENKKVTIIGKGPSLDNLELDASDGHIIALNESIHKVESVCNNFAFMLQQDLDLGESCRPKRAGILVNNRAHTIYAHAPGRYVFTPEKLGLSNPCLSVEAALKLCKLWKVKEVVLKCFDSINGITDYANCVGYKPTKGGNPNRFLGHKNRIKFAADGLTWRFA